MYTVIIDGERTHEPVPCVKMLLGLRGKDRVRRLAMGVEACNAPEHDFVLSAAGFRQDKIAPKADAIDKVGVDS